MPLFWVGKPEQSRICYVSELLDTTQKLTTERTPIQTQNMHTHPSRKTQLAYAINICLCLKTVFGREFKLQTAGLSCFHWRNWMPFFPIVDVSDGLYCNSSSWIFFNNCAHLVFGTVSVIEKLIMFIGLAPKLCYMRQYARYNQMLLLWASTLLFMHKECNNCSNSQRKLRWKTWFCKSFRLKLKCFIWIK